VIRSEANRSTSIPEFTLFVFSKFKKTIANLTVFEDYFNLRDPLAHPQTYLGSILIDVRNEEDIRHSASGRIRQFHQDCLDEHFPVLSSGRAGRLKLARK